MKKTSKLFTAITGFVCLGMLLTACGPTTPNPGSTTHKHTYATTWEHNETNHWHAATCEHEGEKGDEAAHTFNGLTCSVCGYERDSGADATYVFEAEYTDVSRIRGVGYSGGATGTSIIINESLRSNPEDTPIEASNGYFVSYLYGRDLALEFVINSDKAVDNVKLTLRLSAEITDFTITDETYTILVNDEKVSYEPIAFTNVPPMATQIVMPFQDFLISTSVSLVEGENVIVLQTTNDDSSMGGTMRAVAPMVDCIKLETSAVLTWEPMEENTIGR